MSRIAINNYMVHFCCRWKSGFKIAEWNGSAAKRRNRRLARAVKSKRPEAREALSEIPEVTLAWTHLRHRRNPEERFRKVREPERIFKNLCIGLTWFKDPTEARRFNFWRKSTFFKINCKNFYRYNSLFYV